MEIKFKDKKTATNSEKPLDTKRIKLIWMGMLASILVYSGVGYVYLTQTAHIVSPSLKTELPKIRLVLYLVSLVALFVSIKLSRKANALFSQRMIHGTTESMQLTEYSMDQPSLQINPGDKVASAFPLLIISWAIVEAIAFFGLILVFIGGKLPDLYGFSLAAILLMIINRPKIPPRGLDFNSTVPGA